MKNKEEESFSPINPSKVKTKTNSQIRFGMSSNEGDRYLGLNQDKIFFQKLPQSLEINIFGVFDGHSMVQKKNDTLLFLNRLFSYFLVWRICF